MPVPEGILQRPSARSPGLCLTPKPMSFVYWWHGQWPVVASGPPTKAVLSECPVMPARLGIYTPAKHCGFMPARPRHANRGKVCARPSDHRTQPGTLVRSPLCRAYGARRSVALICQFVGKSAGAAWAMSWRMTSAADVSK
jgi:hypothetical protein